jgi:hypothetical protein
MLKIQPICFVLLLLIANVGWSQYDDEPYSVDDEYLLEDGYYDRTPIDVFQYFEEGQTVTQTHQFRNRWKDDYQGAEFDYNRITRIEKKDDYVKEPIDIGFFETFGLILKILGYLAIVAILVLVFRAFIQNGGVISSKAISKKSDYEILEENLVFVEADYLGLAQKAKSEGLYSLAVRYYFLAYLQLLNKEKIIDYHIDKTNLDYRYEINVIQIRNEFSTLSRVFDYCWYSEQDLSEEQFRSAEQLFLQKLKK